MPSKPTPATKLHTFSWDGISFSVPDEWEMSSYETNTTRSHVEMDDGSVRRLVAEWTRLPPRFNALRIQQRYAKAGRAFKKQALSSKELSELPKGWFATLYVMADGNHLLAASCLATEQRRFFSFLIYFYKEEIHNTSGTKETELLRSIADSLKIHDSPIVPWETFDFAFRLSSDFKLAETIFLSGRKQMVFEWRSRRLYVFLISLADMALSGRPLNVFAAEFLNGIAGLRGPKFIPSEDGGVAYQRRAIWALGHADQIFRVCFRYKIGVQHFPERNQIFLWAFHYRRSDDLKKLEGLAIKDR